MKKSETAKGIIFIVVWLLFGTGHCISLIFIRWQFFGWMYPAYNWLMLTSGELQDYVDGTSGWWPWSAAASGPLDD